MGATSISSPCSGEVDGLSERVSHIPRIDTDCQLVELVEKSQKPVGLSSRRTPHSEKWQEQGLQELKISVSALSLAQVLLPEASGSS